MSHELTNYLSIVGLFKVMAILSKACKPDNFESRNSLKLSFTNIRGLCSNFVDCESFLESNTPDILGNFSVRGYLPLIQKDSGTHMHGLAVYVKEGLPFVGAYLKKTLRILTVFNWLYFTQCLTFSSVDHLLCLCAQFLILFHLT